MNKAGRLLCAIITLCMVIGILPGAVFAATAVETVTITDLSTPSTGNQPDYAVSIAEEDVYVDSVRWVSPMDENGNFAKSSLVEAFITVKTKDGSGKKFASSLKTGYGTEKVTINGLAAIVWENNGDTLVAYTRFTRKKIDEMTKISHVTVTGITKPAVGMKPDTTASVVDEKDNGKDSGLLEIRDLYWEGDFDENGCYKFGEKYTLKIRIGIKTNVDYVFPGTWAVGYRTDYSHIDGGQSWLYEKSYGEIIIGNEYYTEKESQEKYKPATMIHSPYVFEGGSGTYEDPYLIATDAQLNAIRQGMDKHYKLVANIDLSGWGNWIPIGSNEAYGGARSGSTNEAYKLGIATFTGSLDGDGHVISGMTINIVDTDLYLAEVGNTRYYGLFMNIDPLVYERIRHDEGNRKDSPYTSKVYTGVRNLGMVNYNINIRHQDEVPEYDVYAGSIAGTCHGSGIYNCYSSGGKLSIDVSGVKATLRINVGGLVASASWSDFRNCYNTSEIEILDNLDNAPLQAVAGGLTAYNTASWFMSCYNTGKVSTPIYNSDFISIANSSAAGISTINTPPEFPVLYHTGEAVNAYFNNCYNAGPITGHYAGGITLYGDSDFYIDNCYNTGTLKAIVSNGFDMSFPIYADASCAITKFGEEYVRRIYTNGNSISGDVWSYSNALGRKILTAIPEDNQPSGNYNFSESAKTKTPFKDVVPGSYYEDAVAWALNKKITSGISETEFGPDSTCTRAQVVTFLWRSLGSPATTGQDKYFKDVKYNHWAKDAIQWAVSKGITQGTSNNTFSPDDTCTTAQVLTFLYRAKGNPAPFGESELANKYPDEYYTKALEWADTRGLLSGVGAEFNPNNDSPRADIVTYLYRNELF